MPETKNNPMDPDPNAQFPEVSERDQEFELLFGARLQRRDFNDKKSFAEYKVWIEQQRRHFGGIIDEAELLGYTRDLIDASATESEFYGLGRPAYYIFKDEIHVFFPAVLRLNPTLGESVDYRYDFFLNNAGVSIGRTQSRVIRAGHWVVNVHYSVPSALRLLNEQNMVRAVQSAS